MISQSVRTPALALFVVCALISSTPAQVQSEVQLKQNLGINPILGAPTVTITSAAMYVGKACELTGLTKLSTCAAGKDCFEVRWTTRANVASLVAFNNFSVKLDAVYANGQQVTGTASTNGNQTQLTISIDRPNLASATSATVKLTATVTLVGLVTSVK